jgi:hypothetical protein
VGEKEEGKDILRGGWIYCTEDCLKGDGCTEGRRNLGEEELI